MKSKLNQSLHITEIMSNSTVSLTQRIRTIPLSIRFSGITTSAFIIYLITLSKNWTSASLEFTVEIMSNDWNVILQRHKLLIHAMAWVFYQIWRLLGWTGKALLPNQVFNAIGGALVVGLVYLIARSLTKSEAISLLTAAGMGFSFSPWIYATESEFVSVPCAQSLFVLWLLLDMKPGVAPSLRRLIGLGFFSAFGFLTFFANAFVVPVVVAGLLLAKGQNIRTRILQVLVYGATIAVIVIPVYASWLYFFNHIHTLDQLRNWQLYGGQGTGTVYGTFEWMSLIYGPYAVLRSLFSYPGLLLAYRTTSFLAGTSLLQKAAFGFFHLILGCVVVSPIFLAIQNRVVLLNKFRREIVCLIIWFVFFGGFAFWWVVRDLKFWYPSMASWWLLVAILISLFQNKEISLRLFEKFPYVPAFGLFVLVMFLNNGLGSIFPHTDISRNTNYEVANSIINRTNPKDLIVTIDASYYVLYFSDRPTAFILDRYLRNSNNKTVTFQELDKLIAGTIQSGQHVYYIGLSPNDEGFTSDLAKIDLTPQDLSRWKTRLAWSVDNVDFLEIIQ